MSNEEIAQELIDKIDRRVMDIGDFDWIEILEEIISQLEGQVNAKKEEQSLE